MRVPDGLGFSAIIIAIAAALFLLALNHAAPAAPIQYPVSIPSECVDLAQREHFPTVIESKAQAVRAKYRLYRLNKSDPLVRQCQDAVTRATQAAQ